jgi:glycosyltransferase involved in cell wall biosynthesis
VNDNGDTRWMPPLPSGETCIDPSAAAVHYYIPQLRKKVTNDLQGNAKNNPMPRILHILSQRPSLTGSGVTLDALVRHATMTGWDQQVIVGVPADNPRPEVGTLDADRIHPLVFDASAPPTPAPLDFPLPGMSDVMPYESTRFSAMTDAQLAAYRKAWTAHISGIITRFRPDAIHSHHVWIVSSLLKKIAPDIPVITHCHATGLRQMELCPHLAGEVRAGCSRNELFAVLHGGHARDLTEVLDLQGEKTREVGAGFREDIFHARGRNTGKKSLPRRILYAGKYSASKGLPWLLDAFEGLRRRDAEIELHVAGAGAGSEGSALRDRMQTLAPAVTQHGQLDQPRLASLMRRCAVCVLPSFYEGVPLVLVEAFACGCRLVSTALPGVTKQIAPSLGDAIDIVPMPRLAGVDTPQEDDLPRFVNDLEAALAKSLDKPPAGDPAATMAERLEPFTWNAVFRRVEAAWRDLIG